jgi:methylated-DNA-[protein]-cysteine S-methyltransferase
MVAATQVLDERVTPDDHPRGRVGLQSPHRPQPPLESSVVALDPVVRVVRGVVECGGPQVRNDVLECAGQVGHHLLRLAMGGEGCHEERAGGRNVASRRDIPVDHLAVLVHRPVDVAPGTTDLHLGLVDEPAATDSVPAGSGRVDDERGEPLHPPVQADVIHLDAAFSQCPCSDIGFDAVRDQIGQYLAGDRQELTMPVAANGDEYQERVWLLVRQIPYGETATYGDLARQLGDGTTPQEVGTAVGRNPVCLLVPCHRVVGAGGRLTGYAGGLTRKRFLLDLEAEAGGRASRLF